MDLKDLARRGAVARLAEIEEERKAIYATFPELRKHGTIFTGSGTLERVRTRKRKPMSAAQRKAVGIRMKKYWAARRAAKR